jgi:hypothetical protein
MLLLQADGPSDPGALLGRQPGMLPCVPDREQDDDEARGEDDSADCG